LSDCELVTFKEPELIIRFEDCDSATHVVLEKEIVHVSFPQQVNIDNSNGAGTTSKKCVLVTTTPYTVTDEDILLVDPSILASDLEINLPASSIRVNGVLCQPLTIKNIHDSNDDRVNVNPDGSEKIDEADDFELKRKESITLVPDGSDWWIT